MRKEACQSVRCNFGEYFHRRKNKFFHTSCSIRYARMQMRGKKKKQSIRQERSESNKNTHKLRNQKDPPLVIAAQVRAAKAYLILSESTPFLANQRHTGEILIVEKRENIQKKFFRTRKRWRSGARACTAVHQPGSHKRALEPGVCGAFSPGAASGLSGINLRKMTDHRNWHLEVKEGRQVWKYIEDEAKRIQTVVDKYHLGLDTVIL